jgi:hypothetical protein
MRPLSSGSLEIQGEAAESPIRLLRRGCRLQRVNLLEENFPAAQDTFLRVKAYEVSTVMLQVR